MIKALSQSPRAVGGRQFSCCLSPLLEHGAYGAEQAGGSPTQKDQGALQGEDGSGSFQITMYRRGRSEPYKKKKSPVLLQKARRLGDVQSTCFPNAKSDNTSFSRLSSTLTLLALVLPLFSYHRLLQFQRQLIRQHLFSFWMCHNLLKLTTSVSRINHAFTVYTDFAFPMTNRGLCAP